MSKNPKKLSAKADFGRRLSKIPRLTAYYKKDKKMTKKLLSAFLCAIVLFLSTSLISCNFSFAEKEPMPEKQSLYQAVESASSEASYKYVSQYLARWGFTYYSSTKLTLVEDKFHKYYVEELPSTYELALAVAYDFLDNSYDTIDLTDMTATTTAIVDAYVAAVGDKYAFYRTPEEYDDYNQDMSGEFCGIGVTIEYSYIEGTMLINSVMRDSPAERAGILPGDYIVGVDGKTIGELGYQGIIDSIKGIEGTPVAVTLKRGDEEITLTAIRAKIAEQSVYYEMLEDNIGYIQISSFKDNTASQFGEALDFVRENGALGVIFDLRSNGGGYLHAALAMLEYLVPEGVVMTSYTFNGINYVEKTKNPDKLDIPCVVLCNQYSASAAELFTSAIRDYGEMGLLDECIVGTVSYGKGIMQTTFGFTDGSSITMTIAYYYTPLGENFHGEGITPDTLVENAGASDVQLATATIELLAKIAN